MWIELLGAIDACTIENVIFILDLKTVYKSVDLRWRGKEFHRKESGCRQHAPEEITMLIWGWERRLRKAERSWRDGVYGCSKDDKYWDPALWSERWTRVTDLNWFVVELEASEVNLEVVLVVERVTARAKEIWTRWRRWTLRTNTGKNGIDII